MCEFAYVMVNKSFVKQRQERNRDRKTLCSINICVYVYIYIKIFCTWLEYCLFYCGRSFWQNKQPDSFFFFFLQGRPDGSSCQTSSSSPDTFRSFGRTHSHCTLLDELQLIKEILQPSPNTLIGAGGGEDTVREWGKHLQYWEPRNFRDILSGRGDITTLNHCLVLGFWTASVKTMGDSSSVTAKWHWILVGWNLIDWLWLLTHRLGLSSEISKDKTLKLFDSNYFQPHVQFTLFWLYVCKKVPY